MVLLSSLLFVTLSSCTKNKRYSKKIEGSWILIKKENAGQTVNISGLTVVLEFGECENGTDNCYGLYREKTLNADNSVTQILLPIETHITDRGKTLNINYDNGANFEKYDILELKRKSLIIQYQNQGAVYTFEPVD